MENNKIAEMMLNCELVKDAKNAECVKLTADEWSYELGTTITPQRLVSMFKAGLVDRVRDKANYGDDKYRYWVK